MNSPSLSRSVYQLVHRRISIWLKFALALGVVLLLLQDRYQAALEVSMILMITFLPVILGNRFNVYIPHEFESLAVIFVYMALFLGEVQGYYVRFWWWDVVLHTGSGLLLGILGFLLVYVLNKKKEIQLELHPKFIALFAFMFAMGIGACWEIYEFAMDRLFGMNMQKSGLVDTMWDLIVDGIGALIISIAGWGFLKNSSNDSFLEIWIDAFIDKNPRLFLDKNGSKKN
ncbi:MAG: hypothetical protein O2971_02930 [Proteobacteria bacterium]|nr:hypothetical protein [Pseudomonadota bacterium]